MACYSYLKEKEFNKQEVQLQEFKFVMNLWKQNVKTILHRM